MHLMKCFLAFTEWSLEIQKPGAMEDHFKNILNS